MRRLVHGERWWLNRGNHCDGLPETKTGGKGVEHEVGFPTYRGTSWSMRTWPVGVAYHVAWVETPLGTRVIGEESGDWSSVGGRLQRACRSGQRLVQEHAVGAKMWHT
jgi:hypothetical protein